MQSKNSYSPWFFPLAKMFIITENPKITLAESNNHLLQVCRAHTSSRHNPSSQCVFVIHISFLTARLTRAWGT